MSDNPPSGPSVACIVCGKAFPPHEAKPFGEVRPVVSDLIRRDHPDWGPDKSICMADHSKYVHAHIEDLLEQERGELTDLDREVLDSLSSHRLVVTNPEIEMDQQATLGERLADRVADLGGSWGFIVSFCVFLGIWMALNALRVAGVDFDPYPFILLNLVLSCMAALQAPVIMMSQRRQETKDRLRAENDYRVNLKAELEIRLLHEKIDHQLMRQWEKLAELQRIQIEALERKG